MTFWFSHGENVPNYRWVQYYSIKIILIVFIKHYERIDFYFRHTRKSYQLHLCKLKFRNYDFSVFSERKRTELRSVQYYSVKIIQIVSN